MRDIRLLADKSRLKDAVDNIGVAFRVMEMLTEIIRHKSSEQKCARHRVGNSEELTSVSEDDSDSNSDRAEGEETS